MEKRIKTDQKYRKVLLIVQIIYAVTGLFFAVLGLIHHGMYEFLLSAATLLILPALYLLRKIFRWQGGWQLETYVYLFTYLGWTLGGAGAFYGKIPYFDKVVHCISGLFSSMLALTLYRMLESRRSREGEHPATSCLFVFFTSMSVAGMFELCEFVLAPILGRDLQHVLDTGVMDTMLDIFVCLLGTVVFVVLMIRAARGKGDPLTDAAEVFAYRNSSGIYKQEAEPDIIRRDSLQI